MAKEPVAKSFQRTRVSGRRYSRSPNDTTAPTAPVLAVPVAPDDTHLSIAWTYGVDANTGITAALCEISLSLQNLWSQFTVAYPTATYTFSGLTGGATYDVRVANQDGAPTPNVSAYSATQTVTLPPSVAQLAPGQVAITSTAITVSESTQISVNVTRTGAGTLASTVEVDYVFENFTEGTPTPVTGTLRWDNAANGTRTAIATAGAVTANRAGQFRITAARALSGTLNPSIGTTTLAVTIQNTAGGGSVLDVGAGHTYATFSAANIAVQPGQTIEGYTGTYVDAFATQRAGTQAAPITVRAAAGQLPVMTGFLDNQGHAAIIHVNHPWWIVGGGLKHLGGNSGGTASWQNGGSAGGKPDRGVVIRASNTTIDGLISRNMKQEWGLIPVLTTPLSRIRFVNCDFMTSGTLDQGVTPKADAADGWAIWPTGNPRLISFVLTEYCRMAQGGHSSSSMNVDDYIYRYCLVDGSWESVFGATYGQKSIDTNGNRGCVEDCIFMHPGTQVDNPSTTTLIDGTRDMRVRRSFFVAGLRNTGCNGLGFNTIRGPGPSNSYIAHVTVWNMSGAGIQCDDLTAATGFWGPFYFKNCIIANCAYGSPPASAKEGFPFYAEYRSTRGTPWTSLLFMEKCVVSSNQQFRIRDIDGIAPTVQQTITQLQTNFPANFRNNIVVDPNFVSAAAPTSTDPATAYAQAQANFLPQAAALLGTAAPLTTVTVGSSGGDTVTLADAGWFRDAMGWAHLTGDTIYFEGVGSRVITAKNGNVITLDSGIGVGVGTNVFLGSSPTPNIGAVM